MAETIFASLISSLSRLALEEANRITYLEEHIESLEKELLLMDPLMDAIQNMGQPDQIAAQWLQEAHLVFLSAEDLASQYTRRLARKKWIEVLKFTDLIERHELALDLERVTLDIHVCSQKGIKILNDRNLDLPFSSDQQTTVEGNNIVSNSTLNKLNEFLTQNRNHLPDTLLECLVSVRDKLVPFDMFLQQVVEDAEADAGLDARQKLWLQEIKDVFQLLEQSLLTFQCSKEKDKKESICEESFSILMLMLRSLRKYEEDLKEKIIEIENRTDRITSRYDLYAIGEFKLKNGSSSRAIVPQRAIRRSVKNAESVKSISMTLLTPLLGIPEKILKDFFTGFSVLFDNYSSISSLLEMDLNLVKALLEDASKMGDSDKRLQVWLGQVMEIYHGMMNLDSYVKETIQRKWGLRKMVGLHKILQDSKEIEKKIEDALVRKTRYGIEGFVATNGNVVVEQQVDSVIEVGGSSALSTMSNGIKKLEEQVQLMKELQLIDALLEDVRTMDKLDLRLKVWLQEILGVAQEAREIVQQDFRGIFRSFNFSKKMNKIRKRMDDISEWKRNYSIDGIRATNRQSRISYSPEAAEPYPSGHSAAEFESLRREVNLMKALEVDIHEMVGIDGKLKAWMKEMHGVIADVDKFIHEHEEITWWRGTSMSYCIAIQEITTLQRHRHSILHKEKIQQLHERRIRYGIESINTTSSTNVVEEPPQVNLISEPAESETTSTMPESITITMNHENVYPYLWRCLFHFLLFPVGKEIPARRLIAVWIAEGIVSPKRGENKPAEYFCQLRLSELTKRGMIEPTSWKINGKVKAYKLCNDIRETLTERAKAANFFEDASKNMTFRFAHHAADVNNPIDHSRPYSSSVLNSHFKKVISFFSFDTTEGRNHGENIGNFLHRCIANKCFRSMRVLDLERVFKPKLPSAVGELTGLRYLGLRWTYLESLPDTVSKLLNLLVLDVKRTYINILPKSIWNMQYLRHLYLSETYRTRFVSRPRKNNSTKSLNDLLTLWGAFIDEDSPVVNGLDTIHNVRKLGLTCRSMSSSPLSTQRMESRLEEVGDWITKLENLEDLRIKSFDDLDRPSDLHVKPFSGHTNLSTVYLVGRLRYPTVVSGTGFPVSMTDITLSHSELVFDPMAALQSLPNLVILRLLAKSTKCTKMECCSTQQVRFPFPKLQVLKIWSLEHFDEWQLGEGSLPNLRDLEIRNCHELKMIPYEIKNLKALSKFWLSHKFEEEIKQNQSTLWEEIKHLFGFPEEMSQKLGEQDPWESSED